VVGATDMTAENHEVLIQAEKLADVLVNARDDMKPHEFFLLLIEMNSKIAEVTKIDYGSICAPSEYSFREGSF